MTKMAWKMVDVVLTGIIGIVRHLNDSIGVSCTFGCHGEVSHITILNRDSIVSQPPTLHGKTSKYHDALRREIAIEYGVFPYSG